LNENIKTEDLLNANETFLNDLTDEINSGNPEGRVIIRPSGTEPLIRISIENKNEEVACTIMEGAIKAIKDNG
ncbi:MAG: phosphoglucosamine mutase, partial [Pseudomonadota bacterium]|nr:phosphoglucosamine mutase [Pseudomonadota bacterium]